MQRDGKRNMQTNIEQPTVIAAYNRGMNGVELLDCALSDLRPVICGRNGIDQWPLQSILHLYTAGGLYCTISGETVPQKVFKQHTVGRTFRTVLVRQNIVAILIFNQFCHF